MSQHSHSHTFMWTSCLITVTTQTVNINKHIKRPWGKHTTVKHTTLSVAIQFDSSWYQINFPRSQFNNQNLFHRLSYTTRNAFLRHFSIFIPTTTLCSSLSACKPQKTNQSENVLSSNLYRCAHMQYSTLKVREQRYSTLHTILHTLYSEQVNQWLTVLI